MPKLLKTAYPAAFAIAGFATWSAPRPNLASSERASERSRPGRVHERAQQRLVRRRSGGGAGRAGRPSRPGPSQRWPLASSTSPSSARSSVVLPEPLGPRIATRSCQATSRSIGPSRNEPSSHHGRVEAGDDVAGPAGGLELELELPGLPRLVDDLEPLDRLLGGLDLGRHLLGALRLEVREELVVVGLLRLGVLDARRRPTPAGSAAADCSRSRSAVYFS